MKIKKIADIIHDKLLEVFDNNIEFALCNFEKGKVVIYDRKYRYVIKINKNKINGD